jgi:hypothetical protein
MLFSVELLGCLVFVQKSNFQEKSWKISQSFYFTTRLTEPEDETERSHEGPTPPGGAGQARSRWGWCGRLSHRLDPSFRLHKLSGLKISGGSTFSQIEFHCAATTRNPDSELGTPFWHPARTGIWRRSSPSSSPTPLHQPSMIPPSMCE